MKFRQSAVFAFLLVPFFSLAQSSLQYNSAEIKLGIKKLNTLGSALYVAAHPDDENTRLLSYLAKEKHLRTGYLSLTRGDGGQNLIGNEQSELLGLIRTQELLAARRTDGAEQFFTRAIDFGFSKNPQETFSIWNKEQILADAVWVIRKFRPDIIITRFPEDERAGHGQHSASAIIAREAFVAAADPKRFPEQLKDVEVWQSRRILWNTANFGGNNTTSEDQLKLNIGGFNPLLGKGYGEIAAESRTNHKSQGFGSARQRGEALEYFSPIAGVPAEENIFEGFSFGWNRIEGGEAVGRMISQADLNFKIDEPSASLSDLIKILTAIEGLKDPYWREQKSQEVKELIAACAGLWFESYAGQPMLEINLPVKVNSQILLQSNANIFLKPLNPRETKNILLTNGIMTRQTSDLVPDGSSNPYWLQEEHPPGMYTIADYRLVGNPENIPPLQTSFTFIIGGKEIKYTRPVLYKFTDPVRGEVYQPVVLAPPITATIAGKAHLFTGNSPKTIKIQLKSFSAKPISATITPKIPAGWNIQPRNMSVEFESNRNEKTIQFMLSPAGDLTSGTFSIEVNTSSGTFDRGYKTILYDHIPAQTVFPLSEARLEKVDLKTGGKNIGYIAGAGDLIPEALDQIGYKVTMLSENQILNSNLSAYDAIITGVRFYNVNEQLALIQPKLMEYVKNGGNLLVQYNVSTSFNMGPYPFDISRIRVTDEAARVSFLAKDHPVLTYPNKITEKDFDGWIQERGLYFTSNADSKYTRVLSMNDPGEKPADGSLLVTNFGKGRFVYTSLAFFRELPAGIPGAYRLFVNLITKNKTN